MSSTVLRLVVLKVILSWQVPIDSLPLGNVTRLLNKVRHVGVLILNQAQTRGSHMSRILAAIATQTDISVLARLGPTGRASS